MRHHTAPFRRHFAVALVLSALLTAAANSQQIREYIYLGNRIVATTSSPEVVSALIGTPSANKLEYPITLNLNTVGLGSISVINILVNTALDGNAACYLAITPNPAQLFLVKDDSEEGLHGPISFPSTGSLSNSQCIVPAAMISYSSSGSTVTLQLRLNFQPAFKGNKILYAAVQTTNGGNSGWQSAAALRVGSFGLDEPNSPIFDGRVTVSGERNYSLPPETEHTATVELWNPLNWTGSEPRIANLLINNVVDGRFACYMAVLVGSPSQLLLVEDGGAGGGPFAGQMDVTGQYAGIGNSQCQINWATQTIDPGDKRLVLSLRMLYHAAFRGYRVFYPAIRIDKPAPQPSITSGWLAGGTVHIL
ncbi:MAG: hypothetical protein R2729_28560 [Bryobacteraceae bacterium]